jgi:hypothetical protein
MQRHLTQLNLLFCAPEIPFGLIEPHRRLVREGILTATYQTGIFGTMKTNPRIFYLFTDMLLWTNLEHKYKGNMNLTAAKPVERKDKSFDISTSQQALTLMARTSEESNSWVEELEGVMKSLQLERNKAAQRARVQKARAKKTNKNEAETMHNLITDQLQAINIDGPANLDPNSSNNHNRPTISQTAQPGFVRDLPSEKQTSSANTTPISKTLPAQSTARAAQPNQSPVSNNPNSFNSNNNSTNNPPSTAATPGASSPPPTDDSILVGEFRGQPHDPNAVVRVEFKGQFKPRFVDRRGREKK